MTQEDPRPAGPFTNVRTKLLMQTMRPDTDKTMVSSEEVDKIRTRLYCELRTYRSFACMKEALQVAAHMHGFQMRLWFSVLRTFL